MKRALATASILLFPALCFAKTTTYDWIGQVRESNWQIAVGDTFHGTLTIDDQTPASEDLGDARNYQGAALLSFHAGDQDFSAAQNLTWFVNNGAQGCGTELLESQNTDAEVDFTGGGPNGSLELTEASNLDQRGPFRLGAVLWDRVVSREFQFWGDVLSMKPRQQLVEAGVGDFKDAAPTPEPSSFILLGSALAAFGLFRFRRESRS